MNKSKWVKFLLGLALFLVAVSVVAILFPQYVWQILGILIVATAFCFVLFIIGLMTGAFNPKGPVQ